MTLILSLLCLVLCLGLIALTLAMADAPEGNESEIGFTYKNGSRKPKGDPNSEKLMGRGVTHVRGVRAA